MNWLGHRRLPVDLAEVFEGGLFFLQDREDRLVADRLGVGPGERGLLEVRPDQRNDHVEHGVLVSVRVVHELVVVGPDLDDVSVDSSQQRLPSLSPCCANRNEATLFQM